MGAIQVFSLTTAFKPWLASDHEAGFSPELYSREVPRSSGLKPVSMGHLYHGLKAVVSRK